MRITTTGTVLIAMCLSHPAWPSPGGDAPGAPPNAIASIHARRCASNPLIDFTTSRTLGDNINGPSVIKAPSWIEKPLGKYYMYFAHHGGKHIRLACADTLEGPWRVHEPGTLALHQAKGFSGHIASPDVHVDEERKEVIMYFHGPATGGQKSGVATSKDGLVFTPSDVILGDFYFRVFPWKDARYAVAKDGNTGWGSLNRSPDGRTPFEKRSNFIRNMRHAAVMVKNGHLLVFYSRVQDAPERIVVATVPLKDDWQTWRESEPIEVLKPEEKYEGIAHPNKPSAYGPATRVRQLRDPCLFQDDGRTYLFYSIAGESGIAMAELDISMKPEATPGGDKSRPAE